MCPPLRKKEAQRGESTRCPPKSRSYTKIKLRFTEILSCQGRWVQGLALSISAVQLSICAGLWGFVEMLKEQTPGLSGFSGECWLSALWILVPGYPKRAVSDFTSQGCQGVKCSPSLLLSQLPKQPINRTFNSSIC